MFDRLIASEPQGAGARSRRNYFLVSTLAVGVLVMTAVVASIFAEELSLGTNNFEFAVLVMPVEPPATEPQPPRQQPERSRPAQSVSQSQVAMRTELIAPVDRPERIPTTTSTVPNKVPAMPNYDPVQLGPINSNPSGSGRNVDSNDLGSAGLGTAPVSVAENKPEDDPPVRKPDPPRVPSVVSGGVVNGQASYLPKPAYPPTALAVRAEGKVDVQVLIDEKGKVISAKAVSGNPIFRDAAENAARNARFSPTMLSNVPVKVTGVIVYNFTRG